MSIPLAELLDESLTTEYNDVWERERTATPIRAFAVCLHSVGLSFRETAAIVELVDVDHSNQVVWQWKEKLAESAPDPPPASPTRAAVDETAVKIAGEWQWVYAAIDVETKLLLDIIVFSRHGTDPAAAFLHGLTEKHDVEDAEFLVEDYGYSTALSRLGLSGRLDYTTRNLIEKWFHTLNMLTDRFHTSWVDSRAASSGGSSYFAFTTIAIGRINHLRENTNGDYLDSALPTIFLLNYQSVVKSTSLIERKIDMW